MLWTFLETITKDDVILSSKKDTRELLIGVVEGDYVFNQTIIGEKYPNTRRVKWLNIMPFEKVPNEIWRSMTAWQTIFELSSPEAIQAASQLIKGKIPAIPLAEGQSPVDSKPRPGSEGERLFEESNARSLEIIAAHFDTFTGLKFQEIVAEVLVAAGLFIKPIKKGADQGIDVEAYRDALRIGPPRILVQVKHREGAVSGPEMREFLGAMARKDDVGLYISTGGYKPEAQKAADKSDRPVNLMGWDDFVKLFLNVYEKLDNEIKAIIPIESVKILRNPDEVRVGEE